MELAASMSSEARFDAYVEEPVGVVGRADRAGPLRDYRLGLLMPVERKSVEPLAAVTAPSRVAARHQSLLHLVSNGPWSDDRMLAKVPETIAFQTRLPDLRAGDDSPSAPSAAPWCQEPGLPDGFRPRGAPDPARAAHAQLDRHSTAPPDRRSRKATAAMSMLQANNRRDPTKPAEIVTQ